MSAPGSTASHCVVYSQPHCAASSAAASSRRATTCSRSCPAAAIQLPNTVATFPDPMITTFIFVILPYHEDIAKISTSIYTRPDKHSFAGIPPESGHKGLPAFLHAPAAGYKERVCFLRERRAARLPPCRPHRPGSSLAARRAAQEESVHRPWV